MNTFATVESAMEMDVVHFYTVHFDGREETEFDDFLLCFEAETGDDKEHFDELLSFIKQIGIRGADKKYFRPEKSAHALPRKWTFNDSEGQIKVVSAGNPIRLYCMIISPEIVILFNGAIKNPLARTAQECDSVRPYFNEAVKITTAIDQLFVNREIKVEGKLLLPTQGNRIAFPL